MPCRTSRFKIWMPQNFSASRLGSFAAIRFARAFDSRRDRILAARRSVFAALNQVVRAFAKFFRFTLREVAALIGFLAKKLARIFSRFRGKQNADQCAHAETHEEVCDLGTYIVRHENLHKNRNIEARHAQYGLTGKSYSVWLSARTSFERSSPSCSNSFSAVFRGITWLSFSTPARRAFATLPNSRRIFCTVRGPMPGMPSRADFVWRLARRSR